MISGGTLLSAGLICLCSRHTEKASPSLATSGTFRTFFLSIYQNSDFPSFLFWICLRLDAVSCLDLCFSILGEIIEFSGLTVFLLGTRMNENHEIKGSCYITKRLNSSTWFYRYDLKRRMCYWPGSMYYLLEVESEFLLFPNWTLYAIVRVFKMLINWTKWCLPTP